LKGTRKEKTIEKGVFNAAGGREVPIYKESRKKATGGKDEVKGLRVDLGLAKLSTI